MVWNNKVLVSGPTRMLDVKELSSFTEYPLELPTDICQERKRQRGSDRQTAMQTHSNTYTLGKK